MEIADKTVVLFDYTLTDSAGNTLDSSAGRGPLAYLHGARNIVPGLEAEMTGKKAGDAFKVTIPAATAYGDRDEQMVQPVSRQAFPTGVEIQVGQQFQARGQDGVARVVTVVAVDSEKVTVDANHPLAGKELTFDVKITEVRPATDEELQHGHVHGPGGHHH